MWSSLFLDGVSPLNRHFVRTVGYCDRRAFCRALCPLSASLKQQTHCLTLTMTPSHLLLPSWSLLPSHALSFLNHRHPLRSQCTRLTQISCPVTKGCHISVNKITTCCTSLESRAVPHTTYFYNIVNWVSLILLSLVSVRSAVECVAFTDEFDFRAVMKL